MSVHSFVDLAQSCTQAIIQAHKASEEQHLNILERFFDQDGENRIAKTVTMKVPSQRGGETGDTSIEVPLISLVPFNSLTISEVELEFLASMASIDAKESDTPGDIKLNVGGGGGILGTKKNNVKVKIKMRGTNPPEGVIRVNDNIVKRIP